MNHRLSTFSKHHRAKNQMNHKLQKAEKSDYNFFPYVFFFFFEEKRSLISLLYGG